MKTGLGRMYTFLATLYGALVMLPTDPHPPVVPNMAVRVSSLALWHINFG